jgi:hypothetical protein
LRYHIGGETTTDGEPDDNETDRLGGEISLGMALSPTVAIQGTYGSVLNSGDDTDLDMIRLRASFVF